MKSLQENLEMIRNDYQRGVLSDSEVDWCMVQLMTPENVDQIVAAYPDDLRSAFVDWMADPTFGEVPFISGQGELAIPDPAIRAARDWTRRNAR